MENKHPAPPVSPRPGGVRTRGQAPGAPSADRDTERTLLRAMFDHAGAGIGVADSEGRLLMVNPAGERIWGRPAPLNAPYRDLAVLDIRHPDGRPYDPRRLPIVRAALDGETVEGEEMAVVHQDGARRDIVASASPLLDGEGRPVGAIDVFQDITPMKDAERALRSLTEELGHARAEAERANRIKSEFLANMSHEIRTPLTGILGMTKLAIKAAPEPVIVREYLALLRQSGESLLAIINDILDLSKIESGRLSLDHVDFDPRQVLAATLDPMEVAAADKDLDFERVIDPALPALVAGDPLRLRQVVTNLTGNAIKFTRSGRVSVHVFPSPDARPGKVGLVVEVRDTGIGIPRDKLETIFDSFAQVRDDAHLEYGGTGLGLTISRRLARMMGGDVRAASEPDKGSLFTFTAVFDAAGNAENTPAGSAEPQPAPPLRLLLAEDNDINAYVGMEFLRRRGHTVLRARNGIEALDILAREHFDAVFMDIRMPRMDGIQTTGVIRNNPPQGVDPGIPIIAVTASALKGDREDLLAAGMDGYITKPIEFSDLDRILAAIAEGRLRKA